MLFLVLLVDISDNDNNCEQARMSVCAVGVSHLYSSLSVLSSDHNIFIGSDVAP